MNRESAEEDADTGVPELQAVLTRYVDSSRGYLQAAELIDRPDFSAAFSEIATRRGELAEEMAALIKGGGDHPEAAPSVEGALHRWWIQIRDTLSDEELEAVLIECIRGEKVLLKALENALDSQGLTSTHAEVLRRAREEIATAVQQFETIIKD